MKILFLSNRVPFPIRDGHSRRTYHILKGLSQRHDVSFLSLDENHAETDAETRRQVAGLCRGFQCVPAPSKKVSAPMIARLLRSLLSVHPYTLWRHYSPALIRRMDELVRAERFDVIHCDILPMAYAARNARGIPFTLTDHDVCHVKTARIARQSRNPFLKAFTWMEAAKLKAFEATIFSRIDLGITVSELDKQLLQQGCPKGRFTVIENGVDTREFSPDGEEREDGSLLWIGGFGYSPNRDAIRYFLEEIYPLLRKEAPGARLKLIGGSVPDFIAGFAARDPSITILGSVADPVPYLRKASVFIAPILSGSGTRLKILEAMSVAKAVVTTTIGCEGIEGVDKKHFLIADTPRDFAQSAAYLLKNGILRRQQGLTARKLAIEKYDWNIIVEKLDAAYRELTRGGRPA